jgi:anti-sigma-K factor RskA
MRESMTHEQAREALEALALDALDASERDAAMAHVADCTTCQSELAALENTANELAYAAAPLSMSPAQRDRIRSRLIARGAADRGARDPLAAIVPPLRVEPVRAPAHAPELAVVTLASTAQAAATGMMFWDRRHDAWTFVAHHVPMPRAGRTYQLWVVTPTATINAGTFMPSPDGEVTMQATHALPKDSPATVVVTDEPEGGSPEPTTDPLLVAR